uniref:DUF4344 domain-containing metallopeptidase n=1 Tax=Vibrio sp. 10N TaxID=3058938 RepID=UPI0030C65A44
MSFAQATNAEMTINYQKPQSASEQTAREAIQQSGANELLVELSKTYFPFNHDLTVQYGGEDGPLYDPSNHTVHMPYAFYTDSLNYFTKNDYQNRFGKPAQQGAVDTLLHTLLHEAGHAYIADQGIPILGKEEDAVDNFAAVIMLNYVEQGADATISAADMFAFESEDRPDYYDFYEYIGEHSFDLQRYFSTLCLVYGSDPDSHKNLLDEIEKKYLDEQKDKCIATFEEIDYNWKQVLNIDSNTSS